MVEHISVLEKEVLELFSQIQIETFVDGTLGAGGHAAALLEAHPEIQSYIGMDQDPDALNLAKKRLEKWGDKVRFVHANFTEFDGQQIDGMLLDIGVSSMQLDRPDKGFSFSQEGPLDMRMNPEQSLTAEEIVNTWSEQEIGRVLRDYGEEKKWKRAARAIVAARPFKTTKDLVDVLMPVLFNRKKEIHPLTLVFQGLRICVNRELEVLQDILPRAIRALNPGGRLAVISFHSLEDRIVKRAFQYAASDKESTSGVGGLFLDKEPLVKILTRKPLIASAQEKMENPRSRSAKLRAVEKLG